MISIIYNPLSGGFSENTLHRLEEALIARGESCRLLPTAYAGHAAELAAQCAAEGCSAIVSYGGDGTANEVLQGMATTGVPLMIAPSGTGNDMIRTLGLPRDPIAALEIQLDSPLRPMDVISVNDRWSMNVTGMGLDVLVLREYERLRRRMFGSLAYKIAILMALGKYRPETVTYRIDDGPSVAAGHTFFCFGNGQYIGGGMKCLPFADPFDGLLDVMHIRPISKLFICRILPTFFSGRHTSLEPVTYTKAKRVEIHADEPFWMQLDGELYQTDHARLEIHPGLLRMRLPQ